MNGSANQKRGTIFNVEGYAVYDGPGIRTIVFLKGCPLTCFWCQNPEGHEPQCQLAFFPDNCIGCGRCASACPNEAVERIEGKSVMNWDKCRRCFKCVEVCLTEARKIMGKLVTAEEVVEEVIKDMPFYRRSGGGITLSGGEPLMQADFASKILRLCKERNISTAIEISGFADKNDFTKVLRYTDFIYYDLKHMDSKKHKAGVGVGNEMILENLNRIPMNMTVIVRVPIVPGYNDSRKNILDTAEFVEKLNKVKKIELLPYNKLGVSKYERLGKKYLLPNIELPSHEEMSRLKNVVETCGIPCEIV